MFKLKPFAKKYKKKNARECKHKKSVKYFLKIQKLIM